MKRLSDHELFASQIEDLIRLARWLNILPEEKTGESWRWYKQRIIRAIQREEKRLSQLPREPPGESSCLIHTSSKQST